MFKKFNVVLFCLLICGCSYLQKSKSEAYYSRDYVPSAPVKMVGTTDFSYVDLGDAESLRVAMLLPLRGKLASMGESMKNAAMMAIGDVNNNNLVVQFYDTKGTSSGARVAFENAMNANSRLILGPLLAEEVAAISNEAKSRGVPVISFSTSPSVLQPGVYSIGLLNDDQINSVIKYAVGQGRKRLAVVLPDNQSGINMLKSVMKAGRDNGMEVTKVGFYSPTAMDFTGLASSMAGGAREGGDAGFDALLVPEYGNRLKSITSMFSYYDVSAPQVLFMGTSVWANTGLSKETELYGAVYPVMSMSRQHSFASKYKELFGQTPNGLGIFAYDAISMASAMANQKGNIVAQIVKPDGYSGMSGLFRILENGQNEHGLDIVRVSAGGNGVVQSAPSQFYGVNYGSAGYIGSENYPQSMPAIYGKDANYVRNLLMQ